MPHLALDAVNHPDYHELAGRGLHFYRHHHLDSRLQKGRSLATPPVVGSHRETSP